MKILVVGKNSFLALGIFEKLNKKLDIVSINYNVAKKKNSNFFKKFQFIINCSINKNYVRNKYNLIYDFDLFLANKIKFLNCNYIFISTRKVYRPKFNITELSPTIPIDNYGKNKLITEKKLQQILKDRVLVLRASNIIGLKKKSKMRVHKTFLDHFCKNIEKNKVILHKNSYKDFLSISQFVDIVFLLIKKNANGVINVSLGKKVYLKNIVKWLNYYNKKSIDYTSIDKSMNCDSFTLNNDKLKKIINYKFSISDLRKDCLVISKKIFKKK